MRLEILPGASVALGPDDARNPLPRDARGRAEGEALSAAIVADDSGGTDRSSHPPTAHDATPEPGGEAGACSSARTWAARIRRGLVRVGRRGASLAPRATAATRGLSDAFAKVITERPRHAASALVGVALVTTIGSVVVHRSRGAPSQPGVESGVSGASRDSSAAGSSGASTADASTKPALGSGLGRPGSHGAGAMGVDLKSIVMDDAGAVASAGSGHLARLTLDPRLQRAATRLMAKHKVPQAAVVAIEPSTGRVLAYASHGGDGHDLAVDASAPSASVFKIVTGATLVQVAGVSPDIRLCYSGGEQRITPADLRDDAKHDAYCATLAQAMGRSINTIFAKLASRRLTAPDLHGMATQLGYGAPIPFDVPVGVSKIELPSDTLGFARTAAGFWNTTLSPLHGALIAATVANGGVTMRPFVVGEVFDGTSSVYKAAPPSQLRKAIEPATAAALERMMAETVSQGTSYKAFHDAKGKTFLPGIEVAGKTGTLNQPSPLKLYTWFVGFAPTKSPKIAIATLVVNDPVWKVKANVLAREVLQAYFAAQGAPGVTSPTVDGP